MKNAIMIGIGSTYLLWIFYLAVMNLKRAKNAGTLSATGAGGGVGVWIDYF